MEIRHYVTSCCITYISLTMQFTLFHTVDASLATDQLNPKKIGNPYRIERSNNISTQSYLGGSDLSSTILLGTHQKHTEKLDEPETYSDTLSTSDAVIKQYLSL